jgi:hypothetical protein
MNQDEQRAWDTFAAAALAGLLPSRSGRRETVVVEAVKLADCMLKARREACTGDQEPANTNRERPATKSKDTASKAVAGRRAR